MAGANRARKSGRTPAPTPGKDVLGAAPLRLVEEVVAALPPDPPPSFEIRSLPQAKAALDAPPPTRKGVVLGLLSALAKVFELALAARKRARTPDGLTDELKFHEALAVEGRLTQLHKFLVELLRANLPFTVAE